MSRCYLCYLENLRAGAAPAQDEAPPKVAHNASGVEPRGEVAAGSSAAAGSGAGVAGTEVPVPLPRPWPEVVPVAALAADLPDPGRVFWWFSTTPLPDQRISAGQPVPAPVGSRLPPEADYWCHEGDAEWTQVDRTARPKPPVRKRTRAKAKGRRTGSHRSPPS